MLHDYVQDENVHVGIYNTPESYLPDWLLEKAALLWDEAEKVAEDEEIWERVHRSGLQLAYAELRRMPMDDPRRAEKMERFASDVRRYGITRLQEFRDVEKTLAKLEKGDLTLV